MICDNCGHFNSEGVKFCEKCQKSLYTYEQKQEVKPLFEKTCYACGRKIEEDARFCDFCGAVINNSFEEEKSVSDFSIDEKNRVTESEGYALSKNIIPYIIALIITVIVCTGLIVFMIIAANRAKNDDYSIKEISNPQETAVIKDETKKDGYKDLEKESDEDEEAQKEVIYSSPEFDKISASSFLPKNKNLEYSPKMTVDNNKDTAWNENSPGDGIGEWVMFSNKKKQYISGIKILNGYCKSEELYYENHRPKTIEIKFDNVSIERELEDVYNVYQDVEFAEPIESRSVKIIIKDLYRGSEYDDSCISEISIY